MPGPAESARLLLLMAKQPRPGSSKTRLSPPLTEKEAADLYLAFLQDKVAQMRAVPDVRPAIAYTPAEGRGFFEELAPAFDLVKQQGESLGDRLVSVFEWAFGQGAAQVMAIDGDTPTLPPDYLRRGFDLLEDPATDIILGPSTDGGYYAIGMKEPHPSLFQVTMSTPSVARDTLARAEAAGLQTYCLPAWRDVDRPEDLERLAARLREDVGGPDFAAPATRQFLSGGLVRLSSSD